MQARLTDPITLHLCLPNVGNRKSLGSMTRDTLKMLQSLEAQGKKRDQYPSRSSFMPLLYVRIDLPGPLCSL